MNADFLLDYGAVPVERSQSIYVLAQVEAGTLPSASERRPLNLCVVVDRSGSMQGDKIAYVRQAAQFLVRRLGAQDRFSLVSYNHNVTVDVKPEAVIHKDRLAQAIGALRPGGRTNLSGGWLRGCELVEQNRQDGQINRVLLLSDGLANEGVTDLPRLEQMARQKNGEGVTTTTMGVGMDFNEDLMTHMAAEGGGAYYFIDNPDQAPAIFAEELQGLMSVVGQNLEITLTLAEGARMARQLNDYPFTRDDHTVTFRMGDLFMDEVKTLLVEIAVPPLKNMGEVEIARLQFDYDELREDGVTHQQVALPVTVNAVDPTVFEDQKRNTDVVKTLLVLEAGRARAEAIKHADRGDFVSAAQALLAAAQAIQDSGLIESPELRAQYTMLREEAVDMDLGTQRYTAYSRKVATSKSYHAATRAIGDFGNTQAMHMRQKRSRAALERSGPTPVLIAWVGNTLPLTDRIRIGRASDNDIMIPEEEVSSHHCEIVRVGDDVLLMDLGSTNGTFANGGQVSGRFRLSVGDIVTVGSQLFTLEGGM